jgi:hypothetical protein
MSVSSRTVARPEKACDSTRGGCRRHQARRLSGLALSIPAVLLCSASASASTSARPVDARSAHVALAADRQYVQRVLNAMPAESRAAESYVASIAQQCPGVLSGLGPLTAASQNPGALAVITEALGDVDIAASAPDRIPLTAFARRATSLRWSSATTGSDVRQYFKAAHAVLYMRPSDLCADAQQLVAGGGTTAPPQTSQWLTTFSSSERAANTTGRVLGRDLSRLSSPTELPVIAATARLQQRLAQREQRLLQSNLTQLIAALGLAARVQVQVAHLAGQSGS